MSTTTDAAQRNALAVITACNTNDPAIIAQAVNNIALGDVLLTMVSIGTIASDLIGHLVANLDCSTDEFLQKLGITSAQMEQ